MIGVTFAFLHLCVMCNRYERLKLLLSSQQNPMVGSNVILVKVIEKDCSRFCNSLLTFMHL